MPVVRKYAVEIIPQAAPRRINASGLVLGAGFRKRAYVLRGHGIGPDGQHENEWLWDGKEVRALASARPANEWWLAGQWHWLTRQLCRSKTRSAFYDLQNFGGINDRGDLCASCNFPVYTERVDPDDVLERKHRDYHFKWRPCVMRGDTVTDGYHAFWWAGCRVDAYPVAINNRGTVLARVTTTYWYADDGCVGAYVNMYFMWEPDGTVRIAYVGHDVYDTCMEDMNESGIVVGWDSIDYHNQTIRALVIDNGTARRLYHPEEGGTRTPRASTTTV